MKNPYPPNRPSRVGAALADVAILTALTLLSACAGPPRRTDVALLMGQSEAIAKIVRPAWAEILAARERSEPLDANYVADVGDIYRQTMAADFELLDAIADHRSLNEARERLDKANGKLSRLATGRKPSSGAR